MSHRFTTKELGRLAGCVRYPCLLTVKGRQRTIAPSGLAGIDAGQPLPALQTRLELL